MIHKSENSTEKQKEQNRCQIYNSCQRFLGCDVTECLPETLALGLTVLYRKLTFRCSPALAAHVKDLPNLGKLFIVAGRPVAHLVAAVREDLERFYRQQFHPSLGQGDRQ